jgi:uncharacterized cupin superfamily protein
MRIIQMKPPLSLLEVMRSLKGGLMGVEAGVALTHQLMNSSAKNFVVCY